MSEREIDTEIAVHLSIVDGIAATVRDMPQDEVRTQILAELIDLARRILEAWQWDRENR